MSILGETDVDAVIIDRHLYPDAEALRMVNAIACTAAVEAARRGIYRAAFRGIRILAVRQAMPCGRKVAIQVIFYASHSAGVMRIATRKPGHDSHLQTLGGEMLDWGNNIIVEPIDAPQVS